MGKPPAQFFGQNQKVGAAKPHRRLGRGKPVEGRHRKAPGDKRAREAGGLAGVVIKDHDLHRILRKLPHLLSPGR